MMLQEREKNILAGLSVLLVFCVYFYALKPALDKQSLLQLEIDRYTQELDHPRVTREKLQEMQTGIEAMQAEIESLNSQIPLSEDRGFLIRDLEALARKNNIQLVSFMPKEAIPVTMSGKEINKRMKRSRRELQGLEEMHAKVLKTAIKIDSKGSFESYKSFFADVLTYYKAVEVSDLIISKGLAGGLAQDKRFARTQSKDPIADARNNQLNVSFTLFAYTGV